MQPEHPPRLLRLPDVMERTGLCRSTVYDLIRRGDFPQPVKLGTRTSAWLESEVSAFILDRVAACRAESPA